MSQAEKVTIYCHGGCERCVTLRKCKVHQADYSLCNSRENGCHFQKTIAPVHGAGRLVCSRLLNGSRQQSYARSAAR